MDIQTEKLKLVRLLIDTESEEVINELKSVFMKKGYDFWDDLPESLQEIIGRGLEDVKSGRLHSHESVVHEIKLKYSF